MSKSAFKVGVGKTGDEVEAERKAPAAVAIGFSENMPDLWGVDDVFYGDAEASKCSVVGFVLGGQVFSF